MLRSKLLSLLDSFSNTQLSKFDQFVSSPYFNEHENLLKLYQYLYKNLSDNKLYHSAKQLDKEVVWANLYENKPFNDAHLRGLASSLLQLAYQFIHAESCHEDPLKGRVAVMERLKAPSMDKHFSGLARQFTRMKEQQPEEGSTQFHQLYYFHRLHHQQIEETGQKQTDFKPLETADRYLDAYYYLEKLKHYCDALGYRNFVASQPEISLPKGFWDMLEGAKLIDFPLINAYVLVAKMLEKPEQENAFWQLKELLFNNYKRFTQDDQLTLFIHLTNYCINNKINAGQANFYPALFEVYQQAIETGIFYQNGRLQPQDYKNIITVGLRVEAFNWVETFIQENTHMLPEENQENALTYNLAKVYFFQKEYEKVIEKLREVEYNDLVYALGSKLMLLRTYYELGEFIALDSLIDSFRIYLRRNQKISRDMKQQYMNVLRFVKQLSKVAPRDQSALQKIQQKVELCNALAAKQWVLKKIEELKK